MKPTGGCQVGGGAFEMVMIEAAALAESNSIPLEESSGAVGRQQMSEQSTDD